jgi:hypothetical protein
MDLVTWWMYRRESAQDVPREEASRPHSKDTAHVLVRRVTEAMGSEVGSQQPNGAGSSSIVCYAWPRARYTPASAISVRGYAPGAGPCTASGRSWSTTRSPHDCWKSQVPAEVPLVGAPARPRRARGARRGHLGAFQRGRGLNARGVLSGTEHPRLWRYQMGNPSSKSRHEDTTRRADVEKQPNVYGRSTTRPCPPRGTRDWPGSRCRSRR